MSIKRMQELAGVKSNQTAIEWFAETVHKMGYVSSNILEQAKEIHKQEIIDAWEMGRFNIDAVGLGEEYYQETFK
jgi:hypothetical protein